MQHNITAASFDEFVTFLFEHEVLRIPRVQGEPEPWYWHAEVLYDPVRIAGYYIRLFTEPDFLLSRYAQAQLEQGFWAIQSSTLSCAVSEMIWDKRIPLEIRESCVRSMFHLFERLFAREPLETSANMWWDSLAYCWYCENRARANGGEDLTMQDVMFETLSKILALRSEDCQYAALHGLNHLMHPDTTKLVDNYLTQNATLSEELREYARAASRFEVM